MTRKLLLAVVSLFLFVLPAAGDNAHYTYEFSIDNAPGGIGDFSWEVTTLGLLPEGETSFTNFNQVSSPTAGGGCKITSVLLEGESGGIGLTTFFMPLCLGVFDSETSGFAVNPAQIGFYSSSGTNPDGSIYMQTFQVFQSNLPVTTPEPGTMACVATGLLLFAYGRKGLSRFSRRNSIRPSARGILRK